jgi:hypothetical protein
MLGSVELEAGVVLLGIGTRVGDEPLRTARGNERRRLAGTGRCAVSPASQTAVQADPGAAGAATPSGENHIPIDESKR